MSNETDLFRAVYKAALKFKRENPGVLEEITRQRKEREAQKDGSKRDSCVLLPSD